MTLPVLYMEPEDAFRLHLNDGESVEITTQFGGRATVQVRLTSNPPPPAGDDPWDVDDAEYLRQKYGGQSEQSDR